VIVSSFKLIPWIRYPGLRVDFAGSWSSCLNYVDKRVVILKGTGGKAFCAGGDIVALYSSRRVRFNSCSSLFYHQVLIRFQGPTASASNTVTSDFFREEYKLNYTISKLPAHVALLNGITSTVLSSSITLIRVG